MFALHAIEFYRNIDNVQSMKGRIMVKWNWRKSRIIFPQKNEHLVCKLNACAFLNLEMNQDMSHGAECEYNK